MKYSEIIKNHNILYLTHFTHIGNLQSILTRGILSVDFMNKNDIQYTSSDKNRFDKNLDMISLSFDKINYKMLYKKKINYQGELNSWIILILKPELLDDETITSYFCSKNAACAEMIKELTTNKNSLSSPKTLELTIQSDDPQKEILINGSIKREYIKEIVVENINDYDLVNYILKKEKSKIPVVYKKEMFKN